MTAGWRGTARLVATAVAAAAVSRAAESLRRLVAEVDRPELDGPVSAADPLRFLEPAPSASSVSVASTSAPHPDRVIAAQARPTHEFGPTPVVTPSRGIGFRSEPTPPRAEMPVISRPSPEPDDTDGQVAPAEPVVVPDGVRTAASIVQDDELSTEGEIAPADLSESQASAGEPDDEDRQQPEPEPEPEPEPAPDTEPSPEEIVKPDEVAELPQKVKKNKKAKNAPVETAASDTGKHRRDHSAISGTVQSSRGRGLRGLHVSVLDEHADVLATATTGAGGAFIVEDLAAGRYLVAVTDDEGDFSPAWHGGATQDDADTVKVKDGRTRRKADVTVMANAAIDLDVDLRKKKAIVGVRVTDRASGAPAAGFVRVSTKLFSTDLALTDGHTTITLRGSAGGTPALSKKVRVDYLGSEHTRPAQAVARLR